MADAAIQELLSRPVVSWPRRSETGMRGVHHLHTACQRAGLAGPCAGDVQRLHAVFDVVMAHGLGSLVLDYLQLVCSDEHFTSSDPVESSLLDGQCVQRWSHAALSRTAAQATRLCSAALQSSPQQHAGQLAQLLAQACSLVSILQVLEGQRSEQRPLSAHLQQAEQLRMLLQVTMWAHQQPWQQMQAGGRFASHAQWSLAVKRRACQNPPLPSQLDLLLQALSTQHGCVEGIPYPPKTLSAGVEALCLQGSTDAAARRGKLALLLYACLDMGQTVDMASFRQAFGISAGQAAQWQAAWLHDEAQGSQDVERLRSACQLFSGSAAGAPFSLVEALHRSGLSKDAVDLLHRSAAGTPGSDAEACTVLDIHLACRSPSQAFLQMRALGVPAGSAGSSARTAALMHTLLQWAARQGAWQQVTALPLNAAEEQVLQAAAEGQTLQPAASVYFALYLVQRGRFLEAAPRLKAVADLPGLPPAERQVVDTMQAALGSVSLPVTASSAHAVQDQQPDAAAAITAALAALSPAAAHAQASEKTQASPSAPPSLARPFSAAFDTPASDKRPRTRAAAA